MSQMEMLRGGVHAGLIETKRSDWGQCAGEEVIRLGATRGLDVTKPDYGVYASVLHHAAIADLIVIAMRAQGPRWQYAHPVDLWEPNSFLDPVSGQLRRFLACSSWNKNRLNYETHCWATLGDVSVLNRPMQIVVAVTGRLHEGRRGGHWSRGLWNPNLRRLRFRRRDGSAFEGTWLQIWREEHDHISREKWLETLLEDDVLRDILFVVEVPVPEESERRRIRDLALKKLDYLHKIQSVPDRQMATCRNPLDPCPFLDACWGHPECNPADMTMFDALDESRSPTLATANSKPNLQATTI